MATAWAVPAGAQDLRAYERRVDTLARVFRAAFRAREEYEGGLSREYLHFDTVRAGAFRLLAPAQLRAVTQAAADSAIATLVPQYGRSLDALSRHVLVARQEPVRVNGRDTSYLLLAELQPPNQEANSQVLVPDAGVLSGVLRSRALQILLREDSALSTWLRSASLPADTAPSTSWPEARIDLLSSYATVARRCYDADLRACRLAFGLTPTTDPVLEWMTPRDRRAMVQRFEEMYWAALDRNAARECINGSDSVCIAIIRARNVFFPDPVATAHRAELLQLAIGVGGSGAMERALSSAGTPDAKLAAAAGISADSVLRLWVTRARNVPKPSESMSASVAATSLGWILLCGFFAVRSSRWR